MGTFGVAAAYFVLQSNGAANPQQSITMKTLARIGAAASFAFFFLAGMCLLIMSGFRLSGEYIILTVLGLVFIGTAFFAGSMISLAGEKSSSRRNGN